MLMSMCLSTGLKMGSRWFTLLVFTMVTTCTSAKPPNIVIMIADDLGIGDVGCFGNDTIRTPHIDSIAAQGAKLTHHLTAASLCTPSRAAFLTGRYPIRMGMTPSWIVRVHLFLSNQGGLPPEEVTLAEALRDEGYASAFIGKWHLGLSCNTKEDFCHHPLNQGFDYYYGVPLTNLRDFGNDEDEKVIIGRFPNVYRVFYGSFLATVCALLFLYQNSFLGKKTFWVLLLLAIFISWYFRSTYLNLKAINSLIMRNYEVVEQPITFDNLTQRLVGEGIEFLENRTRDDRPFFLMMSWVQVHTVLYNSVPGFRGKSKHGEYGDNVEEMDWSVGQILQAIERLGFKDDTFVYFSSDNGGHLEERGPNGDVQGGYNGIYRGGKAQGGMEGGIRVPTVAMWPRKIPKGSVIDIPTSQMDIFPTVSKLASFDSPGDRIIDGVDISQVLTAKQKYLDRERVLIHYCGLYIHAARYSSPQDNKVWKVQYATPKWLPGTERCGYICGCGSWSANFHDPPLLFELTSDPAERKSLDVNEPNHKRIVDHIAKAVASHRNSLKPVTNQFAFHRTLALPWLQPCCNFPSCSCRDKKYEKKNVT